MKTSETEVLDPPVDPVDGELEEELPSENDPAEPDPADPPEDPPSEEDDEIVVSIAGEEPPSEEDDSEPGLVNKLRRITREKEREIKALKLKRETPAPAQTVDVVGTKPTLRDFDWDEEKFAAELEAWHERKRKADEQQAEAGRKAEAVNKAYQARLEDYGKHKAELKAKDFDEAEQAVKDTLSPVQQSIVVRHAANAAQLVYALGKHPKKAQELAAIADVGDFIAAVVRLETQLKVTTRKAPPLPEKKLSGSGSVATGGSDAALERLRAAAEKSGDYTEVNKYRQKLKAQQK